MSVREKGTLVLIIFILCGLVIGGLIGELTRGVSWLNWLAYGQDFGIPQPITLNLGVVQLTFGIMFTINISSIVGLVIAIFLYRKF